MQESLGPEEYGFWANVNPKARDLPASRLDSARRLCYMPGLTRERRPRDFDGRIAQLVEQLTLNQRVQGSSPCAPTIEIKDLADIPTGHASQKRRLGSIWETE
jgi:hypothetical protein